jgi:D-tagatose-1,6-bisphosphate aldolase subunit GatZ/KbaZ
LLAIREAQRAGVAQAICSVCSAHPMVLRAALAEAGARNAPLLVEATCNQVNQFGGYTGLAPADFMAFIQGLAREAGFPASGLILGGDHLGPNPWRHEPAAVALAKAGDLVEAFVRAGFRKLHLDASMACAGEPPLADTVIAERAAQLCARAERAFQEAPQGQPPVYVIGTEVPPPGGATGPEQTLRPTAADALLRTLDISRDAFAREGQLPAWDRVLAVVVQPGVEFGDASVHPYDRAAARELTRAILDQAPYIFEAHSTDYQTPRALRELVQDRCAILKVGPWLTFACREALFALEDLARELHLADPARPLPRLRAALDAAMERNPEHWRGHYRGSEGEVSMARRYSFSDRSRYYWHDPEVAAAVAELLAATRGPLPPQLLSQFLPNALEAVWAGELEPDGSAIVLHAVRRVLGHYASACDPTHHPEVTP